jgi:hypothetical protein
MADGLVARDRKMSLDGVTVPSDLVLQAIRYQLFSPSITCYMPSAICSGPQSLLLLFLLRIY